VFAKEVEVNHPWGILNHFIHPPVGAGSSATGQTMASARGALPPDPACKTGDGNIKCSPYTLTQIQSRSVWPLPAANSRVCEQKQHADIQQTPDTKPGISLLAVPHTLCPLPLVHHSEPLVLVGVRIRAHAHYQSGVGEPECEAATQTGPAQSGCSARACGMGSAEVMAMRMKRRARCEMFPTSNKQIPPTGTSL